MFGHYLTVICDIFLTFSYASFFYSKHTTNVTNTQRLPVWVRGVCVTRTGFIDHMIEVSRLSENVRKMKINIVIYCRYNIAGVIALQFCSTFTALQDLLSSQMATVKNDASKTTLGYLILRSAQ